MVRVDIFEGQAASSLSFTLEHLSSLCPADALGLMDEIDLTGLMLWPSACILARFLCSRGPLLAGKRLLELGAGGTGLPGLAASHFCKTVVLTDLSEAVLEVLSRNVAAHGGSLAPPRVGRLAWGPQLEESAKEMRGAFDVVVGADVIYDFEAITLLAGSIALLLRDPASSCALLTFTERLEEYRGALEAACTQHGLALAAVLEDSECEYGRTITVLIISRLCPDPKGLATLWSSSPALPQWQYSATTLPSVSHSRAPIQWDEEEDEEG